MTHRQLLPRTPGERSGNSPRDVVVAVSLPPPPLLCVQIQVPLLQIPFPSSAFAPSPSPSWFDLMIHVQDVFPACVRLSVQAAARSSSSVAARWVCLGCQCWFSAAFSYSWGRIWCCYSQLVALIRILYVSRCKPKFIETFIWLWMIVPVEYIMYFN